MKIKPVTIKITEHLYVNIQKAARDLETDCNYVISAAINFYLTLLTLDKTGATIVSTILNQQAEKLDKEHQQNVDSAPGEK